MLRTLIVVLLMAATTATTVAWPYTYSSAWRDWTRSKPWVGYDQPATATNTCWSSYFRLDLLFGLTCVLPQAPTEQFPFWMYPTRPVRPETTTAGQRDTSSSAFNSQPGRVQFTPANVEVSYEQPLTSAVGSVEVEATATVHQSVGKSSRMPTWKPWRVESPSQSSHHAAQYKLRPLPIATRTHSTSSVSDLRDMRKTVILIARTVSSRSMRIMLPSSAQTPSQKEFHTGLKTQVANLFISTPEYAKDPSLGLWLEESLPSTTTHEGGGMSNTRIYIGSVFAVGLLSLLMLAAAMLIWLATYALWKGDRPRHREKSVETVRATGNSVNLQVDARQNCPRQCERNARPVTSAMTPAQVALPKDENEAGHDCAAANQTSRHTSVSLGAPAVAERINSYSHQNAAVWNSAHSRPTSFLARESGENLRMEASSIELQQLAVPE